VPRARDLGARIRWSGASGWRITIPDEASPRRRRRLTRIQRADARHLRTRWPTATFVWSRWLAHTPARNVRRRLLRARARRTFKVTYEAQPRPRRDAADAAHGPVSDGNPYSTPITSFELLVSSQGPSFYVACGAGAGLDHDFGAPATREDPPCPRSTSFTKTTHGSSRCAPLSPHSICPSKSGS
jgi:hypothetical protein